MSEREAQLPRKVGRYTLLAPLGRGGMAQVFLAWRDGASRPCVLKQLHAGLTAHEPARLRLRREAHLAALLDHPGIARLEGAGEEAEGFSLAMEYIAGQTLDAMHVAALSAGERIPLELVLLVAERVLAALAYAHAQLGPDGRPLALVHRDLSPKNVMASYDGEVKIIDFGIARALLDEHRTAAGVVLGTPYYMSPEQASGEPVDQRSDLYSFAAVLFELLSGRRLVQRTGRMNILVGVVSDEVPRLSLLAPALPRGLEPVLDQALAKAPAERFPDARALGAALAGAALPHRPAAEAELAGWLRARFAAEAERARRQLEELMQRAEPTAVHTVTGVSMEAPTRVAEPTLILPRPEPGETTEEGTPTPGGTPAAAEETRTSPRVGPALAAPRRVDWRRGAAALLLPAAVAAGLVLLDARREEDPLPRSPRQAPRAAPRPPDPEASAAPRAAPRAASAAPVEEPAAPRVAPRPSPPPDPVASPDPTTSPEESRARRARPVERGAPVTAPAREERAPERAPPSEVVPTPYAAERRQLARLQARPEDAALRAELCETLEEDAAARGGEVERRVRAQTRRALLERGTEGLEAALQILEGRGP